MSISLEVPALTHVVNAQFFQHPHTKQGFIIQSWDQYLTDRRYIHPHLSPHIQLALENTHILPRRFLFKDARLGCWVRLTDPGH